MGWSIKYPFGKGFSKTFVGKAVGKVPGVIDRVARNVAAFQIETVTLGMVPLKWGGTKTAQKAGQAVGITAAVVAGGMYAGSLWATPVSAVGSVGTVAGETGMELEAAAGSGVFWAEPTEAAILSPAIATGTGSTSKGLFSSIGDGLKYVGTKVASGLFGGLLGEGQKAIDSLISKETASMFGGSGGSGGGAGGPGASAEPSGGFSILPIALIGITLIGAFILTRKKG
jgi:hypothetical protein